LLQGSESHAYVRRFEDFVIGWLPNWYESTEEKKKSNGYIIFGRLNEEKKMFVGSYQKYGRESGDLDQ
jgi:hypothetical protein